MLIGWLMKRIFVDRRARQKIDARRKAAAVTPNPKKGAGHEDARKKLLRETMALYREKRVEYEKLDGDLRGKIDKVVREAFGDKKQ
jgi:hypothetical protein